MTQGFTQPLPIPLPVNKGGSGVTTSTGSGNLVLSTSPTITTPNTVGVTNASNASAGSVGEFVSSVIASGSAVTVTTVANITSISLTAGDWDVWGNVTLFTPSSGQTQGLLGWTSTTSATIPNDSLLSSINVSVALNTHTGVVVPMLRYSLSSTTTIYLSAYASNVSGSATVCGGIYARRVR